MPHALLPLNQCARVRRKFIAANPAKAMESNISAHWPNDGTGTAWLVLVDTIVQVMVAVTPFAVTPLGCVTTGLACHW